MAYQDVFERYEIKFFITTSQKKELLGEMKDRFVPDQYGRTTIRNIYYDTESFRLIRDSLEHPLYKEKLRVRSYQRAGRDDMVFVEIKKKFEDVVYKRRVAMPKISAENWISGKTSIPFRTQITSEIDYFLMFYGDISAKAFLSYEREAYCGVTDPGLRLTFDENIMARGTDLDLGSDIWGTSLLPSGLTLMEIKISGSIPMWLAGFLSEHGINKISYSKYGTYYTDCLMAGKKTERSVFYA